MAILDIRYGRRRRLPRAIGSLPCRRSTFRVCGDYVAFVSAGAETDTAASSPSSTAKQARILNPLTPTPNSGRTASPSHSNSVTRTSANSPSMGMNCPAITPSGAIRGMRFLTSGIRRTVVSSGLRAFVKKRPDTLADLASRRTWRTKPMPLELGISEYGGEGRVIMVQYMLFYLTIYGPNSGVKLNQLGYPTD
ncbi:hypothetical protein ACHAWF_017530 [Thalassiosira exigua]